jgi:HK97 family phage prohead protease
VKDFTIFAPLLKTSQSDGKRRLHGTASSTVKDRHGDVITLGAMKQMEASALGMTIFLNHNYQVPEDVAGTVKSAVIRSHPSDPDIHDLVFDIEMNESNPRAVAAFDAIQGGTQLGLSIGARIPEGGAARDSEGVFTIEDIELLETSLVGVPASPRSWVEYAVKSLRSSHIEKTTSSVTAIVVDVEEAPDVQVEAPIVEETASVEPDDPATPEASDEPPTIQAPDPDPATKSVDEEVEAASSDTPQDAPPSNPDDGDVSQSEEDAEVAIKALVISADTLTKAHDVIARLDRELTETKTALTEATGERDQIVVLSQKAMANTVSLLERLAETSKGRKTSPVVAVTATAMDDLSSVYGADVIALLQKEQP